MEKIRVSPLHFGWHVCLWLSPSQLGLCLSPFWLILPFIERKMPSAYQEWTVHDMSLIAYYKFNDFPRTFGWDETTIQHWTSWFEELCLYGLTLGQECVNIPALQWSWFYCFKQYFSGVLMTGKFSILALSC